MSAVPSGTSIRSGTFWANLRPGEHLVQCWYNEDHFIDALEGFIAGGLREGEGVVVIAGAVYVHEVEKRLRSHWLDVDRARWEGRYIPLLSHEVLAQLMGPDGIPDDALFDVVATHLLHRARGEDRRVRFFGDMVASLCAQGNVAGAIALEGLWSRFVQRHGVATFCAYDRELFRDNPQAMQAVCEMHTLVLPA